MKCLHGNSSGQGSNLSGIPCIFTISKKELLENLDDNEVLQGKREDDADTDDTVDQQRKHAVRGQIPDDDLFDVFTVVKVTDDS